MTNGIKPAWAPSVIEDKSPAVEIFRKFWFENWEQMFRKPIDTSSSKMSWMATLSTYFVPHVMERDTWDTGWHNL